MRRSVVNIVFLAGCFSSLSVSAGEQTKGLNPILSLLLGSSDAPATVISAGQVWMDRNLGASRVATSMTDTEAYGDLYQGGGWPTAMRSAPARSPNPQYQRCHGARQFYPGERFTLL